MMEFAIRDGNPAFFGKFMRQLIFLFCIGLVAVCGCGKNSTHHVTGGESNSPEQTSSNQSPTAPAQETETLMPATNRPDVTVDVVIQNNTTNEYDFSFADGLDEAIPVKWLKSGQSQTNAGVTWANWPLITITLGDLSTGKIPFLKVPLTQINDQLASGKYHQVVLKIISPNEIIAACEQGPATPTIQSSNPAQTALPRETDAQMMEQIDREASNRVAADEQLLLPATDRPSVTVDVVIQNDSTNICAFTFESGLDSETLPKWLNAGKMGTNSAVIWQNWPRVKILLGNLDTGEGTFLTIPLNEANDQLASGKYHQVFFRILTPKEVKATCEEQQP